MVYILLFMVGLLVGALLIPFIIYFRARHSGWDDSNIFNVFRVIAHLALHPADFIRMQYEDGKKPFWYLTKDELSEVVDTRPNKEDDRLFEGLWKPADGDDLPEIDREVITLVEEFGHYKPVYAHRPPEYWDGKNILTGEVTRYYPKRYDKGNWNQPDVKWWLDIEVPKTKMEEEV